jgi:hypothetical protein
MRIGTFSKVRGAAMTKNLGMTSRRASTGDQQRSGSRDARTQYSQRTEIVRLPSGSIAQIPRFESIDLPKTSFNEALALALAVNCLCWFGFALILRALFF